MATAMRALILSLLAVIVQACSLPAAATPLDSGIEGQVFIGPTCPVVIEGQACPDMPYEANLVVEARSGRVVRRVETDAQGYFRIALSPGEYVIRSDASVALPFAKPQDVIVRAGEYTRVVIQFDSGIR